MRSFSFAPLSALALLACGGQTLGGPLGDAAADVAPDAAKDAFSDAPRDVAADCRAMEAKLDELRAQARTCCPFCASIQCGHLVEDVCCSISITGEGAPEFSARVAEYKRACGPIACPAVECPKQPSFDCIPGADPKGPGQCR
jgi:hypothetical protein